MKTKTSLRRSVERYQEVQRRIKKELAIIAKQKEPPPARVRGGSGETNETG